MQLHTSRYCLTVTHNYNLTEASPDVWKTTFLGWVILRVNVGGMKHIGKNHKYVITNFYISFRSS